MKKELLHDYKSARNDLADRIGWYCSYCEMPVANMLEVEHVHPVNRGGLELDWDNFLLSCRYCNGVKSDRNTSRIGYFWPDTDNTTHVFTYSEDRIIEPISGLLPFHQRCAIDTIDLMGLNRTPHSHNEPTDADSRWIRRIEAWGIIHESYHDWLENQTEAFARQIGRTASGHGFYSLWIKRFAGIDTVIDAINQSFRGTYQPAVLNEIPELRPGGVF